MHTTNYFDTFIAVAEDCPTDKAEVPAVKGDNKTVANLQFDMLIDNPYKYTSDEVLFKVHALRSGIGTSEQQAAREAFFSKGQACMRASPLTKRYGWGVHYDDKGRMALYAVDSPEYKKLIADKKLTHTKGMRSKRA